MISLFDKQITMQKQWCTRTHTYTRNTEFVGCSPSLSGAIRVNPWSIDSGYNGMYAAICMPLEHRQLRHQKHWRYVSHHTVAYWAQSYITDLMVCVCVCVFVCVYECELVCEDVDVCERCAHCVCQRACKVVFRMPRPVSFSHAFITRTHKHRL